MMRKPQVVVGVAMLATASLTWLGGTNHIHPSPLAALGREPLADSDGDSLPDALEWVLGSDPLNPDSDGDGLDDFLEIVQHNAVRLASPAKPLDDELRVSVSAAHDRHSGQDYVWLHCMFRFAGGAPEVQYLMPFIQTRAFPVPITDIIGHTPMRLDLRRDPQQGLYAIVSMRLATVAEFSRITPCTVNVRAAMSGRYRCSSAYVFRTNGELCTLVPHDAETAARLTVQTLAPHDGSSTPFFSGNRKCEQTLVLTGMSPAGPVYEVVTSDCEVSEGMRCGSECPDQRGTSIIAPDGLRAITGG